MRVHATASRNDVEGPVTSCVDVLGPYPSADLAMSDEESRNSRSVGDENWRRVLVHPCLVLATHHHHYYSQHNPNVRDGPDALAGRHSGEESLAHQVAKVRRGSPGHLATACQGMEGTGDRLVGGRAGLRVVAWACRQDREGMEGDRRDRLLLGPVVEAYRRESHRREAASEGHRAFRGKAAEAYHRGS